MLVFVTFLPDGTFDVFVVDATRDDATGATSIELTVVAGEHKGELVTLKMAGGQRDPIELIGLPGTLTVAEGRPSLRIDT